MDTHRNDIRLCCKASETAENLIINHQLMKCSVTNISSRGLGLFPIIHSAYMYLHFKLVLTLSVLSRLNDKSKSTAVLSLNSIDLIQTSWVYTTDDRWNSYSTVQVNGTPFRFICKYVKSSFLDPRFQTFSACNPF